MKRLRSIPLAISLVAATTGAVLAFNPLPDQAGDGLERATSASGKVVPARPGSGLDADAVRSVVRGAEAAAAAAVEAAEAAGHGMAVSEAARADDSTPDTNHGADVSAVARDNHGQAQAQEHKPMDAGPPSGVGRPEGAGMPDLPGVPDDPGPPAGAGAPEGVGRP